jgi:hypothetical protein
MRPPETQPRGGWSSPRAATKVAAIGAVASAIQLVGAARSLGQGSSGRVALLLSYEAIIEYFDYRIHAEQSRDTVVAGVANQQPDALSKQYGV